MKKTYQMVIKYPKMSVGIIHIPNGHTKISTFSNQDPQKFTQIAIFGFKINHLANLRVWLYIFCVW
jgi:hypothetical protein